MKIQSLHRWGRRESWIAQPEVVLTAVLVSSGVSTLLDSLLKFD